MKRGMIAALAIAASLTGCVKEEKAQPAPESGRMVKCTFTTGVSGESKTTLTADRIETRITDLMIAVYRSGKLFSHQYWSSSPGSIELLLQEKVAFHIYAWANMGDFSATLPQDNSNMADLSYTIPSYESVNQKGFPMSKVFRFRPGVSTTDTILLERLFAKVTVNLECKWPGGHIVGARLGNLNRKLKPFEDSAISDPANDVFEGTPESDTAGGTSATLVLYVPENRQGTIDGITSPEDKSQDKTAGVDAIKDRLTYLEVEVAGNELYQGSMTYRNYLGENATDSFDIVRNTSYIWNIEYYENNLSKDEWKYENDLTDTRYLSTSANIYVTPGQVVCLGDYVDSNMDSSTLRWAPVSTAGLGAIIISPLNMNNLSLPSFIIRPNAVAGASFSVNVAPKNNVKELLSRTIKVNVRKPLNLGLEVVSGEAFPYHLVRFKSASGLSAQTAMELCNSLNLEVSSSNTISGLQSCDYGYDSDGYYITLALVPTMPGDYTCIATTDTGIESASFSVSTPQIETSADEIHLDMRGYDSPLSLRLCSADGDSITDGYYHNESSMTLSLEDPFGTDIYMGLNSNGGSGHLTTEQNYSVMLKGFSGLEGLDPLCCTFTGLTLPATATYTYPNGYSVSKTIDVTIDNPHFSAAGYDGQTEEYRIDMGRGNGSFTVDLTKGGTRTVPTGMSVWKSDRSYLTMSRYSVSSGRVSFTEDLSQWGPLFYGTNITNQHSGESMSIVHSIIRIYDHYDAYATFAVKQSIYGSMGSTWGDINWDDDNSLQHWGCFRASVITTLSNGNYSSILSSIIQADCSESTEAYPIYNGFSGASHRYTAPAIAGFNGTPTYYLGYKRGTGYYDIYYRDVKQEGITSPYWTLLNWRVIAAANMPKFRASGGFGYGGLYCTELRKTGTGSYNFSVMTNQDYIDHKEALYLDAQGYGYQYLHLFWEEKQGATQYNSHTIMNGWWDPDGGSKYYYEVPYYTNDNPLNYVSGFNATDPSCMEFDSTWTRYYIPLPAYRNDFQKTDW